MPYLCQVSISGPEPDADGVTEILDAVSAAIQAGWDAPRIITSDEEDEENADAADDHSSEGEVLDYRVLGYPGGAMILVVLDGSDLMQTSIAVTGLAEHLTTWSPGLLEYSPDEVKISKLDKPHDDQNWLPPFKGDDDDSERPRWHLAELLDDEVQELAAQYLLARAIQSLWDPSDARHKQRASDVVAGAVEDPWGTELSGALGVLLIRAARLENRVGSDTRLIVQGSGTPALAADLLRRARETGSESETEGWTDDGMRGHVLLERFMEDNHLLWNRIPDEEPRSETEDRSNRQLKALLWAGLRALATMAAPLAHLGGPWKILDELDGGTLVSILAEAEAERDEEDAEEDFVELEGAAAAYALVWLTIHHQELLSTPASDVLVQEVIENVTPFHQVIYSMISMAGSGPLRAAVAEKRPPTQIRSYIDDFVEALTALENDDTHESTDFYDDMHVALEHVLSESPELDECVHYLLAVTSLAAQLTETEVNPHRGVDGHVSSPRELTHYLLAEPALLGAVTLHKSDENAAIRTRMLSLVAQVAPAAVADLAAELPNLDGVDPRLEPAARARALRWVENAMRLLNQKGHHLGEEGAFASSADAKALLVAVTTGEQTVDGWPVQRYVSAAAAAAASVLHAVDAVDLAQEVFADD